MDYSKEELENIFSEANPGVKNIIGRVVGGGRRALKCREATKEDISAALSILVFHLLGKMEESIQRPISQAQSLTQLPTDTESTQINSQDDTQCPSSQESGAEKEKEPCKDHKKGMCKAGFKGKECEFYHPKICSKFIRNGRFQGGCTKKKCPQLHVQLCQKSYLWRECLNKNCKERHLEGTRRSNSISPLSQQACEQQAVQSHHQFGEQRYSPQTFDLQSAFLSLVKALERSHILPKGHERDQYSQH